MRPVLLTSITAMLGLLPLVFELNVNLFTRHIAIGSVTSAWWVHLSTAMVFGLLLATVLDADHHASALGGTDRVP